PRHRARPPRRAPRGNGGRRADGHDDGPRPRGPSPLLRARRRPLAVGSRGDGRRHALAIASSMGWARGARTVAAVAAAAMVASGCAWAAARRSNPGTAASVLQFVSPENRSAWSGDDPTIHVDVRLDPDVDESTLSVRLRTGSVLQHET